MNAELQARIAEALAAADQSFADTGDVMEALSWIAFASKHGHKIPRRIGEWLRAGIDAYRAGQARTLDAALGLTGSGHANPRRRMTERAALQGALARMAVLQMLGATIPQAAAMVATLSPDWKRTTLADRYRRRGRSRDALAIRREVLSRWRRGEVEQVLAEYPDRAGEVAEGKAAIRAMYAKHRP